MKRDIEASQSKQASSSSRISKRSKSSQACTSCRRHKTRCEHEGPSSKCHRCRVLYLPCNFDVDPTRSSTSADPPEATTWDQSGSTHSTSPIPQATNADADPASDPNPYFVPSPSLSTLNQMVSKVEDILPIAVKNQAPFPVGRDWTATPMLAVRELMVLKTNPSNPESSTAHDTSLSDIFAKDTIQSLLDIFERKYSPWLNLPPIRDENTPLLDLVRCTITSRHLDTTTRSNVSPRLHRLTQQIFAQQLFNSTPSLEIIHSFLIMSLWAPICSTDSSTEVRDARMLVGSAVNAAMNIRLNEASSYANKLRERNAGHGPPGENLTELSVEMDKARLWVVLSATESILCLGTGRAPLSTRSDQDLGIVDPTTFPTPQHSMQCESRRMPLFTVRKTRDLRSGILAELLNIAEQGVRIRISQISEIGVFHRAASDVLIQMERVFALVSSLPIVSPHESFYSHMLQVQYHGCRLLVIHHFLTELRLMPQDGPDAVTPWFKVQHNGAYIVIDLGRDALLQSEAVITSALRLPDTTLMETAPDHFFSFISFAAIHAVIIKLSVYQTTPGLHTAGHMSSLLATLLERLSSISCAADHAPAKCAQLVAALAETLEKRSSIWDKTCPNCAPDSPKNHDHHLGSDIRSDANLFPHTTIQYDLNENLGDIPDTDIFQDVDFWESFMANLTNDVSAF